MLIKHFQNVIAMLICVVSPAASAWPQEPSAVMGVPIGREVAQLPPCTDQETSPCVRKPAFEHPTRSKLFADIGGLPNVGMPIWDGLAGLLDGRIHTFYFSAHALQWHALKALLVERYGKPHLTDTEVVQNRAGAFFSRETLTWRGQRIRITAMERGTKVSEALVVVSDIELERQSEAAKAEAAKKNAGKL